MTTDKLRALDRQRERWRQSRMNLGLHDPEAENFAEGRLPLPVRDLCIRFVILPADPEADVVEFDEEFWAWWMQDPPHPTTGDPTRWPTERRPSAYSAARYAFADDNLCNSYVACLRSGGLDVALGRSCGRSGERGALFLGPVVGAVRAAGCWYQNVMERLQLDGEIEATLAVKDASNRVLAGFAEGWAPPEHLGEFERRGCAHRHLLLRLECSRDDPNWPQAVAFRLGGQIEDAYGSASRRFIARAGQFTGQLPPGMVPFGA